MAVTVVQVYSANVTAQIRVSNIWNARFTSNFFPINYILKAFYDRLYNVCVVSCSTGDFACNGNCFREYTNNLELCPCQSGCPNGCPCDVYECLDLTTELSTTTTTALTTKTPLPATEVLILSTSNLLNVPVITNAAGRQDRNFVFLYDELAEVNNGCAVTWRNEFFIFGGRSQDKQISKLIGCQLQRVGQLAFNHQFAACANVADEKLYLCFNQASGDWNKCRVATSPTSVFAEINRSSHDHRRTRIAASEGNR